MQSSCYSTGMRLPMQTYPRGMRFRPTDLDLVEYFLHDKADVGKQGCYSGLIHECDDFYGEKEPWVIWDMYGGSSTYEESGEQLYFYTKRIKQNGTGKRFTRKVGSGTWSGEYSKDVLSSAKDGKTKIGTMRNFRYEKGCDADQNGAWLMHEYESAFESAHVICVLRRNSRKATSSALQSDVDNGDSSITKKNRKRKAKSDEVVGDDVVVDHRRKKLKEKINNENFYQVNLRIEESYDKYDSCVLGASSCTQLPCYHEQDNTSYYPHGYYQDQVIDQRKEESCDKHDSSLQSGKSYTELPCYHVQDNNTNTYYPCDNYYQDNNTYFHDGYNQESHTGYYPDYNNSYDFTDFLGNGSEDGGTIDELLVTLTDDYEYYKSGQFEDQLYHGDDGNFNSVDDQQLLKDVDQHTTVDYLGNI